MDSLEITVFELVWPVLAKVNSASCPKAVEAELVRVTAPVRVHIKDFKVEKDGQSVAVSFRGPTPVRTVFQRTF